MEAAGARGEPLAGAQGSGIRERPAGGAHRGTLGGDDGVLVGTLVVVGGGEVQGEHLGLGGDVGGEAFDRLAGDLVQVGAQVVAEAVVGDVAHEAVLEPPALGAVGLEEAAEAFERRRVDGDLLGAQHLGQDAPAEAPAGTIHAHISAPSSGRPGNSL